MDERRKGRSRMLGRPLDDNGRIQFTVMRYDRSCSHCGETVPDEWELLACPREGCPGTVHDSDYKRLRDAAVLVLEGFDKGVFIRQTRDDIHSDWAIKAFRYIHALALLAQEVKGS